MTKDLSDLLFELHDLMYEHKDNGTLYIRCQDMRLGEHLGGLVDRIQELRAQEQELRAQEAINDRAAAKELDV